MLWRAVEKVPGFSQLPASASILKIAVLLAETKLTVSFHKAILRLAKLLPVATVLAMGILLIGNGCGKGIFPEVTPTGSGTATPSSSATAFVYASNFNDGSVSAFSRATNGALTLLGRINTGSNGGPMGLTVTPDNVFVYVVNSADSLIQSYLIQNAGIGAGTLSPIGGAGTATGATPQQIIVDKNERFVYVTNAGGQSLSEYSLGSQGALTAIGTLTGFTGTPFGILEHPAGSFIYVTDSTAGLVYTFTIGSGGGLTQLGSPIASNGTVGGQPGLMAITQDSTQTFLFVDDMASGQISIFTIAANGVLTFGGLIGTGGSKPIGIGAVNNGGSSGINYVFTANVTGNFVLPFSRSAGTLTQLSQVSDLSGPTGLAIDPNGRFVYTGNSGNGTIGEVGINASGCGGQAVCLLRTVDTENPANSNAGTQFIAVTH
jgi:DNA-binding beta-propeller fold protein YncE